MHFIFSQVGDESKMKVRFSQIFDTYYVTAYYVMADYVISEIWYFDTGNEKSGEN